MITWLLCALLGAGQADAPAPDGVLFDRVVAWVDGETVTQNELYAEASLQAVAEQGFVHGGQTLSESALQAALRTMVGELLVAREARRVGAEPPAAELVEQKLSALLDQFPSQEAYGSFVHQLGVDDAFVLDGLTRRLTSENYLAQRLRTRLLHDEPSAPGAAPKRAIDKEREREQRFAALVMSYRQELWRNVPVRLLRPGGALERVTSP